MSEVEPPSVFLLAKGEASTTIVKSVVFQRFLWYNKSMIPSYIRPFLWSYNTSQLDLSRDKKRIITNVLNLGTSEATRWLFKTYSHNDLEDAIINPLPGEWSKKSLNFWSLVLDIKPGFINKRTLK